MTYFDSIYPIEFEIKNTTDTARSASYLENDTEDEDLRQEMISIFPLWTFHLNVATCQHYFRVQYIFFS
jgi:hypothetical protein